MHGIDAGKDTIHVCWKSGATGAPQGWIRLKKTTGGLYAFRVLEYATAFNKNLPELTQFSPSYGSSDLYTDQQKVSFTFNNAAVFPAKNGASGGVVRIHRGAVRADGTILPIPSEVFWEQTELGEGNPPNKFQVGDVTCSLTGNCEIMLSDRAFAAGEIFFLSLYKDSFTVDKVNDYFLFGDLPASDAVPFYEHLFSLRSF